MRPTANAAAHTPATPPRPLVRTLTTLMAATDAEIQQIIAAVRPRRRFVISSHSRPDGDSIGSQLAMAFALRALGKEVTVVNLDAAAPQFMAFAGVRDIR